MDFLKEQFHESLIAEIKENELTIAESKFNLIQLLIQNDPVGYETAFTNWKNERKFENLSKANEILELFDNKKRFKKLKVNFEGTDIIPFVGAGMSISSGYPGWSFFLRELRKETRITEQELESLIECGFFEEAAQKLFDDLPAGAFDEALENHFGLDEEIFGPIQYFPKLFKSCIITTNFDSVLKRCYDRENLSFSGIYNARQTSEIRRILSIGSNILIKLHGDALIKSDRVITLEEYKAAYESEDLINKLFDVLKNRTLLFMGCSLSNDRTIKTLKAIVEREGHENVARHYAFVPYYSSEDRLERRDYLAEANIYPIWYEADDCDHDEVIESLLFKLDEDNDSIFGED